MRIAHILSPSRLLQSRYIRIGLVYAISLIYVIALGYFISKDKMHLVAIPIGLLIVIIALQRFQLIFWITLFFVPLSLPLKELIPSLEFNMFLPTEPLLAGMLLIFIIRLFVDKGFDRAIIRHPISQVIILYLFWILLTSVTSTMPEVSIKYFFSRFWFIAVFFFMATQILQEPGNLRKFIWVYLIPLAAIVVVITIKHAGLGLFDQKASNPAVDPFFNDHTLYGAIMTLMIPVAFGYVVRSKLTWWQKIGAMVVLTALLTGLLFSYSRAAWLSLIGGIGIFFLVLFKIPGKTVLLGAIALLVAFMLFGKTLLMTMERNDQDSSDNLTEHVQSMSNITTDASNLERLNRWSCALRMWADKPFFGFGPGTYMFQYAAYQKDAQKTIISTNAADGGNAHSEYLGPLSEMGVFGALIMLMLLVVSIRTGIRAYHRLRDPELKMLAITVTIGLITYYFHGILNNFLDTDKASAGVWGFLAIIVVLDQFSQKQEAPD
ncbi:MAG: O-antigen ligase family protein [Bacteroidales bacterium]|nr:O-antigen ligase family protein [Bacteroidales bacterium]